MQGKINIKYLLIVLILAIIVGGGTRWFLNQNNNYFCRGDSDCVNTCCGCIHIKDRRCDKIRCEVLPIRECKCIDGKCEGVSDETADWETYRNEEYGFEIKYPSDYAKQDVESENTLLNIIKDDSHYFQISFKENYNINQITSTIKNAEQVSIENHLGYEYFYVEGAGASKVLLIQLGQDALSISLDYIDDKDFPEAEDKKAYVEDIFDQILSTFRFLE